MGDLKEQSPARHIFAHLTDDERIDHACELLALGVLRLAQKRGLLRNLEDEKLTTRNDSPPEVLHLEAQSIELKEAA